MAEETATTVKAEPATTIAADTTTAATTTAATTTDQAATRTAATTTDKAAATTTAASTTEAKPEAKGAWPDNWLERLAKGDADRAKDLKKFQSPEALADSYVSLQKRFSSGEYKSVLPKDATDADITAWRKDNGIPEKPEGYDLKGLEIPETDKDIVGKIIERLHKTNASPAIAREAIAAYYEEQKRQYSERLAKDEDQRQATLDALNQEWSGQFRRNLNLTKGLLDKFPETVRASIASARLPDGTLLFNNADAVRGLTALALELNPAGIIAPAGEGNIQKGALDEYKDIQKLMRENRRAYDRDAGKQARFLELADYLKNNEIIDGFGNEIVRKQKAA